MSVSEDRFKAVTYMFDVQLISDKQTIVKQYFLLHEIWARFSESEPTN